MSSDQTCYFVVRDALGKHIVYEYDLYDVTYNREHGHLIVDRRNDPERIVGWYAPGQWVSALMLTADELDRFLDEMRDKS